VTSKALLLQKGNAQQLRCTVVHRRSVDFICSFWLQFQRKRSKTKSFTRGLQKIRG